MNEFVDADYENSGIEFQFKRRPSIESITSSSSTSYLGLQISGNQNASPLANFPATQACAN